LPAARSQPGHRAATRARFCHSCLRRQPARHRLYRNADMVKRIVVGAHYGTRDWLAQRITAVIMAVYTVIILLVMVNRSTFTYETWKAFFAAGWMRIATLLFAL